MIDITELLNADTEPRTQSGGQVWANKWKRWTLTVANVLSIEHPTANASVVPERPRQVLGTDLFSLNGRTYLSVVDYFSRFIEISILLASQKSSETTRALKSVFAKTRNAQYLEV